MGGYYPIIRANLGHDLIDEDVKELFYRYSNNLKFLPVRVHSTEFGDKNYYISYLIEIHDVIDPERCRYVLDGDGEPMITVPAFDRRKVGDMHIFTTKERLDIVVSSEVSREMRKKRMLRGLSPWELLCTHNE